MTNLARLLQPNTPRLRLIAMPNDQDTDSTRAAQTETAGPPSSTGGSPTIPPPPHNPSNVTPSTLPPPPRTQEELDAEAEAIRASLTPAGIAKVAADKLIEMYQYSQRRDFNLLDPEGALATQQRRLLGNFKTEVVNELGEVVERITKNAMQALGERIEGLARGQVRQGEDIEELKRDMRAMKTKMGELEQKIQNIDARSTPTPPPAVAP